MAVVKPAYYNELEPYAAQWLRNLIAAGHIPPGDVDDRSILDVRASDLRGYGQCHFFAGIGGFGLACRLAGIPDDAEIWTGGFPCQPFSVAGRQRAQEDDRHLWPVLHGLIEQARPAVFVGENVAGIIDLALDGVLFDLEAANYACRAFVVPACAVNAPHRRDRVWIAARNVADAKHSGCEGWHQERDGAGPALPSGERSSDVEHAQSIGRGEGRAEYELRSGRAAASIAGIPHGDVGNTNSNGLRARSETAATVGHRSSAIPANWANPWAGAEYRQGADGKARRIGTNIRELVDGLPRFLAGMRPSAYAEASKEVVNYGKEKATGPRQVLRDLQESILSEPAPYGSLGIKARVRCEEILLPYLRELERKCDAVWCSVEVAQTSGEAMRSLRVDEAHSCSPHQREPARQQDGEHPKSLHSLSWILAQHAGKAWEAHRSANAAPMGLLAKGVPDRVAKLKAFGNAIVPQVAAEIIKAVMARN